MKKTIMARAWEMYKAAGCSSRAEFGMALKAAWAEAKAPKISAEDIAKKLGGKDWTHPRTGEVRIYVEASKIFEAIQAGGATNKMKAVKMYVSHGVLNFDGATIHNTYIEDITAMFGGKVNVA